jgi:signal peptidase I
LALSAGDFGGKQRAIFFGATIYARLMVALIIFGFLWLYLDLIFSDLYEDAGKPTLSQLDDSPSSALALFAIMAIGIGYGICALSIPLIYFFGQNIRARQRRLNDSIAAEWQSLPQHDFLVTYLRPFVTSGRIRVPNLDDDFPRRHLYGVNWDIELALTKAVADSGGVFAAIGHQTRALGAAKIFSEDRDWKQTFTALSERSDLLLMLPLGRPATLWEVRTICADSGLASKTLFLMPSSRPFWTPLRAFRIRNLWATARRELADGGIHLPAYKRTGGAFLMDGGKAAAFCEVRNFHPEALKRMVSALKERPANTGRAEALSSSAEAIKSLPRRRRIPVLSLFNPAIYVTLILALCFRSFRWQPFRQPSGHMQPTILVGDYFVAEKWSYGFSRASWANARSAGGLGDLMGFFFDFDGRLGGAAPKRGDLVVFRSQSTKQYQVERLIGLPGDKVQVQRGALYINGAAVKRDRLAPIPFQEADGETVDIPAWRETLPGGKRYVMFDRDDEGRLDNTERFDVPPGNYFVLGDDRDNSADSRTPEMGFVPADSLVGRVSLVALSWDPSTSYFLPWTLVTKFRFERLVHPIK